LQISRPIGNCYCNTFVGC